MKEKVETICRLPNNPGRLCLNPNGDGHCGECDLAQEWIISISEQFPDRVLRLRRTTFGAVLQADKNRPKAASIVKGIVFINSSSLKQP
ncbi:MAG: hypothetical protein WC503_05820 [Candidatus Shapirobacteria bacterium]